MNLRKIVRSHWKNVIPALAVIVVVAMAVIVVPAVTEQSPTQRKTDGTAGTGRPQPGKKSGVGPGQGKTPAGSSTTNPSAANDGTSEPPNTGSPSVGGSPSHPIQVKALTTGHEVLKPGSSVQTASIHGGPGGMVLVWVGGLVGGDQPAPAPSVSGAGLGTFRMLETTVKKEDSPRRLSLFGANVPSHPVSGRIRIDFGQQLASSEWIWAVVHVGGRSARQIVSETEGGFVNEYTINFPASTAYRDAAIAGFLIGRNGQEPVPGSPMRQLVVAEGPSPGVTLFLQWTNDSVRSANVRWQRPGHSVGIAVEMGS